MYKLQPTNKGSLSLWTLLYGKVRNSVYRVHSRKVIALLQHCFNAKLSIPVMFWFKHYTLCIAPLRYYCRRTSASGVSCTNTVGMCMWEKEIGSYWVHTRLHWESRNYSTRNLSVDTRQQTLKTLMYECTPKVILFVQIRVLHTL